MAILGLIITQAVDTLHEYSVQRIDYHPPSR
jgi:hypothetical protein